MERAEIRLELLKLCFRHDRSGAQVISEAKILEAYALEGSERKPEAKPVETKVETGKQKKFSDKTDILS